MAQNAVRDGAPVYSHLGYEAPDLAVAWLERVFGFRERVRMMQPDGASFSPKLEAPGGSLVAVAGLSPAFTDWFRAQVPDFRSPQTRPWPSPSHTTTVQVADVDAQYQHARGRGATLLMPPNSSTLGPVLRRGARPGRPSVGVQSGAVSPHHASQLGRTRPDS
jgi:uncharacterized glyoxalase superfamily protein PhnB